ncbi:hypothetical protein WAI453_010112 [Rhynchosporium graminicola]
MQIIIIRKLVRSARTPLGNLEPGTWNLESEVNPILPAQLSPVYSKTTTTFGTDCSVNFIKARICFVLLARLDTRLIITLSHYPTGVGKPFTSYRLHAGSRGPAQSRACFDESVSTLDPKYWDKQFSRTYRVEARLTYWYWEPVWTTY